MRAPVHPSFETRSRARSSEPDRKKQPIEPGLVVKLVMPGLVPGIHVLRCGSKKKDVDGRDKPGHDENRVTFQADRKLLKMLAAFSARLSG
jgi:hypothetical protein